MHLVYVLWVSLYANPSLFSDILSAGSERLDEILDICGTALLGNEVKGESQSVSKGWSLIPVAEHDRYDATFPLHLEPLPRLQKQKNDTRCRGEIRHSEAGEKENAVIHGGDEYDVYSSQDILGEVGETYGRLLDAVAAWCGVTRDDVLAVTEVFERRIVRGLESAGDGRHQGTLVRDYDGE
jgi:hypothetical protein